MRYEIANPHPAGTIASLKQLGYTIESAVADLVDKHHGADTQHRLDIRGDSQHPWVAVVHDGRGITGDELITAMTIAATGPGSSRGQMISGGSAWA